VDDPTIRILVVDDEPSVGEALALGLASHDFAVEVAANGESGVRLGRSCRYAVLIIDLGLPDMDGIEVIRRIQEWCPKAIPIVITARATEENRREARKQGVTDFLEKPFGLTAIRTAISQALAERRPVIE
jgi:two-component system, OmpR family, KDP operon response regulator KdpE